MPYFVYRIPPDHQLSLLGEHPGYKEAKQQVTELRVNRSSSDEATYRMVFAKDRQEARRLLTTRRDISSPLEEWEEKL